MGFWKNEWNKLDEEEKKKFMNTFKTPVYLLIAIIGVIIAMNIVVSFI